MENLKRQKEIYTSGSAGLRPVIPLQYEKLREMAREKLSHKAFTYIDGGAGTDNTIEHNSKVFTKCRILPRVLTSIDQVSTDQSFWGQQLPVPFMYAPIGVLELAHRSADLGLATASATNGVPMIFSNQGSVSMEQAASRCDTTSHFFQLYWSKSDDLVRSLVSRAEACGSKGIVVTLDTTVLGWRSRDLSNGYLPFLDGLGIAQYTSDPVFQSLVDQAPTPARDKGQPLTMSSLGTLLRMSRKYPGGTWTNLRTRKALKGVRKFIEIYSNPALSWAHIEKLRKWTSLPVILKGILHPEDAIRAVDLGVDSIIVSNHGGRQIDGAVSSFEALPAIVSEVGSKIDVVLDSGIRTGADIFKCLALGAKGVLIGRPYAYALAVGGASGVIELTDNLREELALTMILAGCRNIDEITIDKIKLD